MSSREEFEAFAIGHQILKQYGLDKYPDDSNEYDSIHMACAFDAWQASRAHESELLAALKAITNSGPDAIPIKEAFEMAHMAIERATGGKV